MNLNKCPKLIAESIAERSSCRVKVGACLADNKGRVFSIGWNNAGIDGYGSCAEWHAIRRANPKRLEGSSIFVWGKHRKTGNPVPAKPCKECQSWLFFYKIKTVHWNDKDKGWKEYSV